jgi:hypothetical protein
VPTFIELLKIESWDTGILGNKINCMYLLWDLPQYRGIYYSSVKIFNHLLQNISKRHNNIHIFKTMLRNYLVKNAFYSIDKFLSKYCNS